MRGQHHHTKGHEVMVEGFVGGDSELRDEATGKFKSAHRIVITNEESSLRTRLLEERARRCRMFV